MKCTARSISTLIIIASLNHIEVCTATCSKKEYTKQAVTIAPFYGLTYPFSLPPLPYAADALEPYIDKETMTIHHSKHHQAYVNNLNDALAKYPEKQKLTLFELLTSALPKNIKKKIRNQGGGHFNHSFFWTIMKPAASENNKPTGALAEQINKDFGSFEAFQEKFNTAAKTVFGSGWAWLVADPSGKLKIRKTHDQDSPLTGHHIPILGLDVWEHAYYLKYQNRRADYITAFWYVINWDQVQQYYEKVQKITV